ncbi:hypothetical protein PMAYCL1PPCAC_27965, partial [Pristionchus mayeri]
YDMSGYSEKDLIYEMKGMEKKSRGRSRKRKCEVDNRGYFPILALPNELSAHVFSFLSVEDRFKTRVNKRLNTIELESKYYVENLTIGELSELDMILHVSKKKELPYDKYRNEQEIMFKEGVTYSSDFIKRMAKNTSMGQLAIKLDHRVSFHLEVYNLLKEFTINHLILDCKAGELINKSFLLQLANSCKDIEIPFRCTFLSTSDVHELYEIIQNGSTKLRSFKMAMDNDEIVSLLSVIGVTTKSPGRFSSNRNCEVFRLCMPGTCNLHIFDGNMELWINHLHEPETDNTLYILSHETQESLDKAKYGRKLEKIEVESE